MLSFSNPGQELKALAVSFALRSLSFLVGDDPVVSKTLSGGEEEMEQASIAHLVVSDVT